MLRFQGRDGLQPPSGRDRCPEHMRLEVHRATLPLHAWCQSDVHLMGESTATLICRDRLTIDVDSGSPVPFWCELLRVAPALFGKEGQATSKRGGRGHSIRQAVH